MFGCTRCETDFHVDRVCTHAFGQTIHRIRSYVDRLFAERDLPGLYHLISVVGAERPLPEEFWLFSRLLEWVGSTRSGLWQYYERLSSDTFTRMSRALEQFGLSEIAERYRFGQSSWDGPDQAASLDE